MSLPHGETIRSIPPQKVFSPVRSHDREGGVLINPLLAGATYDSGVFQVRGHTDVEVCCYADQIGVVYFFLSPDPNGLITRVVGNETAQAAYGDGGIMITETYRHPCRAEYVRILYVNDAQNAQTIWEFSIQFRPIGRS